MPTQQNNAEFDLLAKTEDKTSVPVQDYNSKSNLTYLFDPSSLYALTAAYHSGRPLLVRGDPGTGKSQLAHAAAEALDWQFLSSVVTAHTEIQDLWYHFDTVNRLGHAQLMSAMHCSTSGDEREKTVKQELCPKKFLSPGVLWWAYDWKSALNHCRSSEHRQYVPESIRGHKNLSTMTDQDLGEKVSNPSGIVLLIDEIDKADSDLPNSLLETLDRKCFEVPWIEESVGGDNQQLKPLVIITTNEERQLPPAFLRRCLVLNLNLPDDKMELTELLIERGKAHFDDRVDPAVMLQAAEQLIKDRTLADDYGYKPPGQAEYLDILRVLQQFDKSEQSKMLNEIQDFALRKHPDLPPSEKRSPEKSLSEQDARDD